MVLFYPFIHSCIHFFKEPSQQKDDMQLQVESAKQEQESEKETDEAEQQTSEKTSEKSSDQQPETNVKELVSHY
jgi:hypothetical protein